MEFLYKLSFLKSKNFHFLHEEKEKFNILRVFQIVDRRKLEEIKIHIFRFYNY